MPKKIDPQTKAAVLAEVQAGKAAQQVADDHGVSVGVIYSWLKKVDAPRAKPVASEPPTDDPLTEALADLHHVLTAIASAEIDLKNLRNRAEELKARIKTQI